MSNTNIQSKVKMFKVIAITLVISGILYVLGNMAAYYQIVNKKIEVSPIVDVGSLIPGAIVYLLYCLLIAYGLFKLRKWTLYLFVIPVLWFFFWGVFEFLIGQSTITSTILLVVDCILGIMAIYIYRNRHVLIPIGAKKDEK